MNHQDFIASSNATKTALSVLRSDYPKSNTGNNYYVFENMELPLPILNVYYFHSKLLNRVCK